MVRAPCCDKVGLKKGPWTPEEDQILISHIQQHGHSNWRALPKQAGLLRCGKSCRLRWINYLKPDIKRGNFTKEEEETIIKLHEMLGNRWSAIAAKLPGRTDNEIKNVWHTHLKKRLLKPKQEIKHQGKVTKCDSNPNLSSYSGYESSGRYASMSPQETSSSENSTVSHKSSADTDNIDKMKIDEIDSPEILPIIDEEFWSEPELSISSDQQHFNFQTSHDTSTETTTNIFDGSGIDSDMDFWYNLLINAEGLQDLPELFRV